MVTHALDCSARLWKEYEHDADGLSRKLQEGGEGRISEEKSSLENASQNSKGADYRILIAKDAVTEQTEALAELLDKQMNFKVIALTCRLGLRMVMTLACLR